MSMPTREPWPPVPPDVDRYDIDVETPAISITGNSEIYRIKGDPPKAYKTRTTQQEYELQGAAGDSAMKCYGRVLMRSPLNGEIYFMGFLMDLAAPIPKDLPLLERKGMMHKMILAVQ